MPFKKGESGNPKGRKEGTANKVNNAARELFLTTIEGEVDYIAEAFEKVRQENPEKYLDLLSKYVQYFVPKKTENSDTVKHEFPTIDMDDWK